jgi:hypothetical protein
MTNEMQLQYHRLLSSKRFGTINDEQKNGDVYH